MATVPHASEAQPMSDTDTTALTWETVALSTDALTVAHQVSRAPDICWVMVDEQQQYYGVVDIPRLLGTVLGSTVFAEEKPPEPGHSTSIPRQVSMSNTALLTYIGHELKTPLTSLLGLSSLLKMGDITALSDRQHRYVGLIQQHCRRLADWVNTLIDLGRIESGTLRLMPQMILLSEVWQQAYQQAILRVGHEHTSPPPLPLLSHESSPPVTLVADSVRLQQMLSCFIQAALSTQSELATATLPLHIQLWDNWLVMTVEGVGEVLPLEQLSQPASTLPFATTTGPATPIAAEIGHWLEWLLVRKLAQAHRGELVFTVQAKGQICPTLLLPQTPTWSREDSRLLLVLAPLDLHSLDTLWQQAHELNYRLLITQSSQDALEIASHLSLKAVLVFVHAEQPQAIAQLRTLHTTLKRHHILMVALVPPVRSSLLGQLPADREVLWPTERLGSVLLQPPATRPSPSRLTILYLQTAESTPNSRQKFPNIFHDFGCRVLEVSDLEQASLLKRVWKPDVAVLDPEILLPRQYLDHLSRFPELSALPLITLTLSTTQAARQIAALSVFPCLVEEADWDTPEAVERLKTWLIQVIQMAATASDIHPSDS
jgi:hypothetical protein